MRNTNNPGYILTHSHLLAVDGPYLLLQVRDDDNPADHRVAWWDDEKNEWLYVRCDGRNHATDVLSGLATAWKKHYKKA